MDAPYEPTEYTIDDYKAMQADSDRRHKELLLALLENSKQHWYGPDNMLARIAELYTESHPYYETYVKAMDRLREARRAANQICDAMRDL